MRKLTDTTGDDVAPAEAFMAGGGGGGDPQLEALAETIAIETMEASSGTPLDTTTAPIALEQGQLNQAQALVGGGGPPGGGDTGPSREYIWGPGDGGGGLDELLVQFAEDRTALYILQDAGGDIVATARQSAFEFWTTVHSQYTFDAYGCVQTAEVFAPHAPLHAGHKGLFFDRLDDNAPFDPSAGEAPSLIPFTQHLYHVRNRSYCPQLGRWMQRDPNATALTLLESSAHHGRGMTALAVAGFAPDALYGDGYNLYEYLGSNSWMRSDPSGLEWDPFDMVDDYIMEDALSKIAYLEPMYRIAEPIGLAAFALFELIPIVGEYTSFARIVTGTGGISDYIAMIPFAGVAGKGARFIGRAAAFYRAQRALRAAKRAGKIGDDLEIHHLVPLFMGGMMKGFSVILSVGQHHAFHDILDDALFRYGLPRMRAPERMWKDIIERYADDAEVLGRVYDALDESVRIFARAPGGVNMQTAFARAWLQFVSRLANGVP